LENTQNFQFLRWTTIELYLAKILFFLITDRQSNIEYAQPGQARTKKIIERG